MLRTSEKCVCVCVCVFNTEEHKPTGLKVGVKIWKQKRKLSEAEGRQSCHVCGALGCTAHQVLCSNPWALDF